MRPNLFFFCSKIARFIAANCCEALVKSYGGKQEFITPHSPAQNRMAERNTKILKEKSRYRHHFESLQSHLLLNELGSTSTSAGNKRWV